MNWASDGGMNGNASLILMLGSIDERTRGLADDFQDVKSDVKEIKDRLVQGDKRMDLGDRRMDQLSIDLSAMRSQPASPKPNRLMLIGAAMTGIAPVREWVLGLLVVFVGIKGLIAPADLKVLIFEYFK